MTEKKYTLKPKDVRFLKAVDQIIAKHQRFLGARGSESILSTTVFGKRNVISRIRASERGVTQKQIEQFASHFDLDFNFFYVEKYPLQHLNVKWTGEEEFSLHKHKPFIQAKGDHSGNIYNSQVYVYLEEAKKIVKSTPPRIRKEYSHALDVIGKEALGLEEQLKQERLRSKIKEKVYADQILQLQQQLIEARNKEIKIMEDYITVSKNGQAKNSDILSGGGN
ncbi:hypothetical protein [Flavilitoribacter nigricans]|uniref:Uncharacterized protein n=1 Tax=Flavilitoribacter nigricans (strain ATCC 23147 / DSM 23189 / NBRC 102662 / NCIMB 1420 / SS-2) TaxID=1122177 RepID=A0A2D0NJJ9_FLAN2|nr:hypothetical protein [Flavilitoribacter nigricans]PHN08685.1 hypothetical protein CRP01_01880 [Flavilitoribacter nigricans DSM 23189 = NBRC 102662]